MSTGKITRLHAQPFSNLQFESGLESLYRTSDRHKTLNNDGSTRNKQLYKLVSIVVDTTRESKKRGADIFMPSKPIINHRVEVDPFFEDNIMLPKTEDTSAKVNNQRN